MKPDVLYVTEGRIRDGVDGVRDVDAPCDAFRNGVPVGRCWGDGHYICQDCVHLLWQKTYAGEKAATDAAVDADLEDRDRFDQRMLDRERDSMRLSHQP